MQSQGKADWGTLPEDADSAAILAFKAEWRRGSEREVRGGHSRVARGGTPEASQIRVEEGTAPNLNVHPCHFFFAVSRGRYPAHLQSCQSAQQAINFAVSARRGIPDSVFLAARAEGLPMPFRPLTLTKLNPNCETRRRPWAALPSSPLFLFDLYCSIANTWHDDRACLLLANFCLPVPAVWNNVAACRDARRGR